jgi:hypothetical protein
MRVAYAFAVGLVALTLQACASTSGSESYPPAATFRRVDAIEFYDFRLGVSHAGDAGVLGRDCSTGRYHCYVGVSVLIAPRRCSTLRRLIRSRADWRVNDAVRARFLFRSEQQLYYASDAADRELAWRSNGAGGFAYDAEMGVVGVWHSQAATRAPLDQAAIAEIVVSTKWLEAPRALFVCS